MSDDPQLIEMARKLGITGEASEASAATEFASITRYEHVRVEIVANLSRPGILVLNDAWHANWRARVNGQPHHIGVVNEAFRGLALPAGRHVIEMSYAPRTLLAAKILTALGLLIAFALFAARQRIDPLLSEGCLHPAPRRGLRRQGLAGPCAGDWARKAHQEPSGRGQGDARHDVPSSPMH